MFLMVVDVPLMLVVLSEEEEEEEEECRRDWQVFWCSGRVTYCCREISNDGEQIPSKW